MDYTIRTEKLSVVYLEGTAAETKALNEVSVKIKPEEFVIVFGPSGCGKSTLLYTLSGAERRIAEGEIWVGGKDLRNMGQKDLVLFHRDTVGFVFQAHNLIPTISVLDNVTLPLVFRGISAVERTERGMQLLRQFGVDPLATKLPHELSGGQQQRVGIARALANNAEILLADEPTGNLDSKSADTVMQSFQELNEKMKKTIVLVTHSPKFLPFASHVIHMKDGKVIKDELQVRKRWQASAITDPALPNAPGSGEGEEGGGSGAVTVHADRLINHVGLNLPPDTYMRLEETLRRFFRKEITQRKLFEILDTPYKSGGVGLYKQTAETLAQSSEDILIVSDILSTIKTEQDVRDNSAHIMTWVLHDTKADLRVGQIERLKEALIKRITQKYGAADFQKELDTSFKDGGVGLNWRTAKNLSQKLEVVLD